MHSKSCICFHVLLKDKNSRQIMKKLKFLGNLAYQMETNPK